MFAGIQRLAIFILVTAFSCGGYIFTFSQVEFVYKFGLKIDLYSVVVHIWVIAWAMYFIIGIKWIVSNYVQFYLCVIGTAIAVSGLVGLFLTMPLGVIGIPLIFPAMLLSSYILAESKNYQGRTFENHGGT